MASIVTRNPGVLAPRHPPIVLRLILGLLLILLDVPIHPTTTSKLFCQGQGIGKEATPSLATSTSTSSSSTLPPPVKNILYIIVDDLTADLALFGGKVNQVPMPNLEGRLAPRAVNFLRSYAQQSICGPSRNSFLSGRHPDETQTYTFRRSFRDAFPDAVSLPQAFKNAGFLTCGFGKTYHDEGIKSPPDYDNPYSWSPECPYYAPPEEKCGPDHHGWCTPDMPEGNFTDGLVTEAAIERLRAHVNFFKQQQQQHQHQHQQQQPFFFAVGIRKPHLDWAVPRAYVDAQVVQEHIEIPSNALRVSPPGMPPVSYFNCTMESPWQQAMSEIALSPHEPLEDELEQELRRAYYAAISWMDANVGKLLDALVELGLEESTSIVFHSDHGFHLSEEGMWCKQNTREIGTRVPLLISTPSLSTSSKKPAALAAPTEQVAAGEMHSNAIVQLVDIYPTLLELAGLALPDLSLRGKSLVPLLRYAQVAGNSTAAAAAAAAAADGFVAAFSQYPRCLSTPLAPSGLAHEGFLWNRQCAMLGNEKIDVMGYSIRVEGWRYTEWYQWEGRRSRPRWSAEGQVAVELYEMDKGRQEGKEEDVTPNVVEDGRFQDVRARLSRILYEHFSSLQREQKEGKEVGIEGASVTVE
ncbi:iduronate 2-sulfatase [Nannochloropsis oceanica]